MWMQLGTNASGDENMRAHHEVLFFFLIGGDKKQQLGLHRSIKTHDNMHGANSWMMMMDRGRGAFN
jgi:hypothetical protein